MALQAGTRLGQYEIIGLIGAGGMGEVYRARDSKLKSDVAIKALPDEFSRDHSNWWRAPMENLTRAEPHGKTQLFLKLAN